jgi:hypothetical protein
LEPDAAFAARVAARLPVGHVESLGRAAMTLLPATIAALVILAWLAFRDAPAPAAQTPAPTEDLLTWVIAEGES